MLRQRIVGLAKQACYSRGLATSSYVLRSPGEGLSLQKEDPGSVAGDRVRLRWLAAGVDPLDRAAVNGEAFAASFVPSSLPGVPGSEGVAVVDEVGPDVVSLKSGDHVIPIKTALGTWCESSVAPASDVASIPKTVPVELAATLSTSPFTALRLLADFGRLSAGDVVVQNEAGSPTGTAIVQIAKVLGIKTVSLVNESYPDYALTVERLKLMGGDVVVGESYADSAGVRAVMDALPAPKLGLNGAEPASCAILSRLITRGGTVVTHSAGRTDMAAIKANDLSAESFSLSDWLGSSPRSDVEAMVKVLTDMIENKQLTAWLERAKFEDLAGTTMTHTVKGRKLVAVMPATETL